MAKLMGADPMAQALSARLTDHDAMASSNFWTEERRAIVLSLPTESGEKVLNALLAGGHCDEASQHQQLLDWPGSDGARSRSI